MVGGRTYLAWAKNVRTTHSSSRHEAALVFRTFLAQARYVRPPTTSAFRTLDSFGDLPAVASDRVTFRRDDRPGLTQHVIARGVHGDRLAPDREWGIELMRAITDEAFERSWSVLSLCMMGTHYHLLVSTPDASLAEGLCRAHSLHANRRNHFEIKRRGHVFGRRYTAIPVRDQRHLYNVIRYIPLNPVVAGLCQHPADWGLGTYRALAGLEPAPRWLALDRVYASCEFSGPAHYRRFIERGRELPVPPLKPSDWTRYEVQTLADGGMSATDIAARIGVTDRHVRRLLRDPVAVPIDHAWADDDHAPIRPAFDDRGSAA